MYDSSIHDSSGGNGLGNGGGGAAAGHPAAGPARADGAAGDTDEGRHFAPGELGTGEAVAQMWADLANPNAAAADGGGEDAAGETDDAALRALYSRLGLDS